MEAIVGKPLTAFTTKEFDTLFNVTNKYHEDDLIISRQVLRDVSVIVENKITKLGHWNFLVQSYYYVTKYNYLFFFIVTTFVTEISANIEIYSFPFQIGKVVALDLFFNQWDRMPVVWDNEGNFDNILIEQQGKGYAQLHNVSFNNLGQVPCCCD